MINKIKSFFVNVVTSDNFQRTQFDLTSIVIVILLALFFLPIEAEIGFFSILIGKIAYVSIGILYAHISRKFIFPYINFEKERRWDNNVMIILWYVVVIYCFAHGG